MTPRLPKDFLWTDKNSMEEFFELDPLNEDFYDLLSELPAGTLAGSVNCLDVFNEVYYQATRLIFELPQQNELRDYVSDIKANIGWNYSAQLVMSMLYHLLLLYNPEEKRMILVHTKPIRAMYYDCPYWKPFKHLFERLRKEGRTLTYKFDPCPLPAVDIYWRYGFWNKLTNDYDMEAVIKILGLWKNERESAIIAGRIMDSMIVNLNSLESIAKREQLKTYINEYKKKLRRKNKKAQSSPPNAAEEKDAEMENILKENEALKSANKGLTSRIEKVEADLALCKSQSSGTTNKDGSNRTITLYEIKEYCVGCVEWADAKPIVAMLNKMLRRVGSKEDSDLVDSIETEFLNRRQGNTFNAPVGQVVEHVERIEAIDSYGKGQEE